MSEHETGGPTEVKPRIAAGRCRASETSWEFLCTSSWLIIAFTAGLVARDCWPHEGSRHHHDNQRKAAFRLRSVAVGYAGIAQCEYRDGTESDASAVGCPASLRSGFLTIIFMKGFK